MANYIVDNFSYTYNGEIRLITVSFNDDNNTFTVVRPRPYRDETPLTIAQRGKTPGTVVNTSCKGFSKYIFKAILDYPFCSYDVEENSTDCGFTTAPEPPPLEPDECTLLGVDIETEPVTEIGYNDGSISVEVNTSDEVTISLYKNNDFIESVSANEYTFKSLGSGEYRIEIYNRDRSCIKNYTATVNDASYKEKYYFTFCEQQFDKREVLLTIYEKGYAGAPIEIKNAGVEVAKINYSGSKEASELKFKPILGSECTVTFIANSLQTFNDIYTNEENKFKLELKYVDTDGVIWTGFILPDQSEEVFEGGSYEITFRATDGIKLIEDYLFPFSNSRMTFLQGIKYCLDRTGLRLGFKTSIDLVNPVSAVNGILEGYVGTGFYNPDTDSRIVQISSGSHLILGDEYSFPAQNFDLTSEPRTTFQFFVTTTGIIYRQKSNRPYSGILLFEVNTANYGVEISNVNNLINLDTLADHTFSTNRFIKSDGDYEDCLKVLEAILRQFTAQVKQCGGYWVIENIGNKARHSSVLENAYTNDLVNIYKREEADLFIDLNCGSNNYVLRNAVLENGAGYRKSIVKWLLGMPQPVVDNWNFEQWNSDGTLKGWEYTNTSIAGRRPKIKRVFNPTTGDLIEEEDGTYYVELWNISNPYTTTKRMLRSSPIAVFSQEIITVSFQYIGNAYNLVGSSYVTQFRITFVIQLGSYYCVNIDSNGNPIEPIWTTTYGHFAFLIGEQPNEGKFPPIGDNTNCSFEIPAAPAQGYLTVAFVKEVNVPPRPVDPGNAIMGIDNFKISKRSPNNATVIYETLITVENTNKYTVVPEDYEVYFGDVNNVFRTDSIKDLTGVSTSLWKREGIEELSPLNDLLAREILSQFQKTYRILEGRILANGMNIRSAFNLPTYPLYRFAVVSGEFDIYSCTADLTLVEVYAEEGENSGPIGGGSGSTPEIPSVIPYNVIGFGDKIITDGNNNIFTDGY